MHIKFVNQKKFLKNLIESQTIDTTLTIVLRKNLNTIFRDKIHFSISPDSIAFSFSPLARDQKKRYVATSGQNCT